jgi:ParB/RepB/Spo0J family partition protein
MAKEAFRNQKEVIHHIPPVGEGRKALDAKLAELEEAQKASITATVDATQPRLDTESAEYQHMDIHLVYPGRFQPRFGITPESVDDLAADITQVGRLLNPITVRADGAGKYEIIAGERRWRACAQLGWPSIPVAIITGDLQTALMLSLSENIQRKELTEMEVGFYLKRMLTEGVSSSKRALAIKVGMDRRDLYRYLSFTDLNKDIQAIIRLDPAAFSGTAAEMMLDLCSKGFSDRVQKAASMVLEGKLNVSALRKWVTNDGRGAEPDKRPIMRDGTRIGTISFGKDELRIRLAPLHRDIKREDLAALVSATILSSGNDEFSMPDTADHADEQ